MIEGHGDDLYRYGDRIRYNFSTNIIGNADHTGLKRHLVSVMDKIGSYPEPEPYSLERMIAAKVGVPADCVVVTNGATDAMYRIAHIFEGRRSAVLAPSFREYQDACKAYSHDISFFNRLSSIPENADCIWLCNPNNPTGEIFGKHRLLQLASERQDACLVIDQAYADYTDLPVLAAKEAVAMGNVVLLSSLTKRFAIPGLRIGYAVTSPRLAKKIREAGMPWAVNALAIEAGKYLLENEEEYSIDRKFLHEEALRIAEAFRGLGIMASHTDCNFILCRLPECNAADLKQHLAEKYGILIRDASNFESLDERYFRIAAQSREANDLLIKAVKEWMGNLQ